MATKKSNTKVAATVVVPALNKKNAMAFAGAIFSTKGGMITCLKLCDGSLQNGKDGGRTMHCAVGEAYATFVSPSLKTVLRKDRNETEYHSKYSDDDNNHIVSDGSTAAAIDALVDVASLKKDTLENRIALAVALDHCVHANDNLDGNADDMMEYIERSRDVAERWVDEVVPLLK